MPRPAPTPPDHLLTPRQALVFMLAILVGLAAGILAYLAEMPAPHAVLLGLGAAGTSLPIAHKLIAAGPSRPGLSASRAGSNLSPAGLHVDGQTHTA